MARLRPGATVLAPRLELSCDDTLDTAVHGRVRERLERWLGGLDRPAAGAVAGAAARRSRDSKLGGAGRGIAFRLAEQLGNLRREEAASLLGTWSRGRSARAGRLGVRFGLHHLYLPDLLKPAANEARARLLRVFHGRPIALPPPGRTVLRAGDRGSAGLGLCRFRPVRAAGRHSRADRRQDQGRSARRRHVRDFAGAGRRGGTGARRAWPSDGGLGLSAGDRWRPGGIHPPDARRGAGKGQGVHLPPGPPWARRSRCWHASGWPLERRRHRPSGQVAVACAVHPQPAAGRRAGGSAPGAAERADRRQDPPTGAPGRRDHPDRAGARAGCTGPGAG